MTIRNLDALFAPTSIAVIGASNREGALGARLAQNLFAGGFQGPIMPVHPRHRAVSGVLAYPEVASLPLTPDLAVIATPPHTVPGLVAELGARGTRAAVVITAGFGEGGSEEGHRLRQAVLDAAKPHLLRVVGPNCVGIQVPGRGIDASFAHLRPPSGGIAFVTQSGAMVVAVLDWAAPRGIGFSHIVSFGDMIDVDLGDMLDYLANDPATTAILLYVEAITHSRKFMSAARAAARVKPVIAVKAGRHAEGARAAASHTGALAGADAVYDAAFARAGVLRVFDMVELFDAVETLSKAPTLHGERLTIVTNGGGIGVLATDALIEAGGRLAELAPKTIAALDAVLPSTWSRANPVDIIGDAPAARYAATLDAVLEDPGTDALLVLNCPTAVASGVEAARAVAEVVAGRRRAGPAVLTSWVGEATAAEARRILSAAGLPTYATPDEAIRAFMHLVRRRRRRRTLLETPPSLPRDFTPDRDAAEAAVRRALDDGREWLSEPEAKSVLAAYGIPVASTEAVSTAEAAREAAKRIGGPIALKILSRDITHKSDVGGVVLDLETPEAVAGAARAMAARIAKARPEARLDGFAVQSMVRRPHAHELIVGMVDDIQFGPVILFGQGGTSVEVADDKALSLPPLNLALAHEAIAATRVSRFLAGYRDRPPADVDAVALAMVQVSQLVSDIAEIAELDINPLLADAAGVIALDARIRVALATRPARDRLAICSYPAELEEEVRLPDGGTFRLRPVKAEDAPAFHAAFAKLTPEDVRLRFFAPIGRLTPEIVARLTQIDYDRELALLALAPGDAEDGEIFGVVRIIADPDNARAEFAVIVRSDVKGRGLGALLMDRILAHARRRGIGAVWGDVLRDNRPMLALADELGFVRSHHPSEADAVRVTLALGGGPTDQASSGSG